MSRLRTPAAAIASASPTLATHTPTAPAAIWRTAISGHLCVFACGRNFLPTLFTYWAIFWTLRSKRSRSSRSAGVGISERVMAGRIPQAKIRTPRRLYRATITDRHLRSLSRPHQETPTMGYEPPDLGRRDDR